MPAAVYLYVDVPVPSLQFDLTTEGTVTLDPSVPKQISTGTLPDGRVMVIVYGLSQAAFQGRFASVDSPVSAVANVVGANPDATRANCQVTTLSRPQNVRADVRR